MLNLMLHYNDNCNANNYNNNNKCCKNIDRAYVILKDKETWEDPDVYGRTIGTLLYREFLTFVDCFTAVRFTATCAPPAARPILILHFVS
jgi:hypothetical protein